MKKSNIPDFTNVRRYHLSERKSKVCVSKAGTPYSPGGSFRDFLNTLPDILAAGDFNSAANAIVEARSNGASVVLGMGAHPIKVGLCPVIINLINEGLITAIATNGASVVHDFELAYMGYTSEDVLEQLNDGSFGMAYETGVFLNEAINKGVDEGNGIGYSIGKYINSEPSMKHSEKNSIFAACFRKQIPITVHVAIGTDIIHMHPEADGAKIGLGSMRDFRIFTSVVSGLTHGVFINLGSAVLIPEVFLKALTLARNTGSRVDNFTAINMDFIRHYRAHENVLKRPTANGGRAISLIGHHELMFPLLAAAVLEKKADYSAA
ncbi:MAG: deoxyhypusine synthase family protein [Nitrospirae bacterium]|nr:deoxyhypusine synthase family protein [Nitrospirota bacterium]MBF0535756.1 deoxyhypusine synthase family protein [Nitrospirota bacterium]MBF0615785.1 deoxyhypusine synthase family protein [Nitrospirota bacterium]